MAQMRRSLISSVSRSYAGTVHVQFVFSLSLEVFAHFVHCYPLFGADASMYFNLLSTVIDIVPLGAFSSRQTAVEWVSLGGAHHTPIVLSSVVIDQCKTLVLDSYVRQLFRCAIDDTAFDTASILESKNEKDLKHEKELVDVGASSAASLAAKEAMVDRSKSFWQTSKWAKKLSQSVVSLLFFPSPQSVHAKPAR